MHSLIAQEVVISVYTGAGCGSPSMVEVTLRRESHYRLSGCSQYGKGELLACLQFKVEEGGQIALPRSIAGKDRRSSIFKFPLHYRLENRFTFAQLPLLVGDDAMMVLTELARKVETR